MANYLNRENLTFDFSGKRFAIVVSKYHQEITDQLLRGALDTLKQHDVPPDRVDVWRVPGAWELPLATRAVMETGSSSGVVALGVVIRGETTHDVQINRFVSQSLGKLALDSAIPVGFGLLTCNTVDQAIARSGGAVGNKGHEATVAMLEMVCLLETLNQ